MTTGGFLVPRPSDRQEGGIKREQVEQRGWRETGLGSLLPPPGPRPACHLPAGAEAGQAQIGPGVPGHEGDGDLFPVKEQLQLRKPCVWIAGCPPSPCLSGAGPVHSTSQPERISLEEHVVAKRKGVPEPSQS